MGLGTHWSLRSRGGFVVFNERMVSVESKGGGGMRRVGEGVERR